MDGKILLFGIDDNIMLAKIRRAAEGENVLIQPVDPRQCGKTIGQLALLPEPGQGSGEAPLSEPMMVLCVRQEKLDGLLAALRKAGVPPICKAILTPTNAGWTPARLLAELQRERAEFLKMQK